MMPQFETGLFSFQSSIFISLLFFVFSYVIITNVLTNFRIRKYHLIQSASLIFFHPISTWKFIIVALTFITQKIILQKVCTKYINKNKK